MNDNGITPDQLPPPANHILSINITATEVKDILKSLQFGKAVGPDQINNRILRELADELSFPLCCLFNYSLQIAEVPSIWKEANVCPIFKSGDPSLPSNYRPVSLLSAIDKVFEKIIFKHAFNFLQDESFITSVQSGFFTR